MRSLQDYVDIYRSIATNNNLVGDSVEMLVQMLAQASYISEVENVSYVQEASLEKAKLMNSKIQRCVDDMYSVFRGTCPRVILNIRPKAYFTFNMYDEIVKSNSFKVYFLGQYIGSSGEKNENSALLDDFKYGTITLSPSDEPVKILGFIAAETSDKVWQASKTLNYYLENTDNSLSNDMWVKVSNIGEESRYVDCTREFSEHIMDNKIFDLTLPSFGSRLYVANVFQEGGAPENTIIQARYYKYSTLSNYPTAELKKISIKGADLVSFNEIDKITKKITNESKWGKEDAPGIILIDSNNRDNISTVHYKASRNRYLSSLLRSNSDITDLLLNMYPEKIAQDGAIYKFDSEKKELIIYYAPKNVTNLLTLDEIEAFKKKAVFYLDCDIKVLQGNSYIARFDIDLELFQASSVDEEVRNILLSYNQRFGISLEEETNEIEALISKIPNVKRILSFSINYIDSGGNVMESGTEYENNKDREGRYYNISCSINSTINSNN